MPDADSAALHAEHALNSIFEAERRKRLSERETVERLKRMHDEPVGQTTSEDGAWGR